MPTLGAEEYEISWSPLVLGRLGQVHNSLGNRDAAIRYCSEFTGLWKEADPALQARVEAVRAPLMRDFQKLILKSGPRPPPLYRRARSPVGN